MILKHCTVHFYLYSVHFKLQLFKNLYKSDPFLCMKYWVSPLRRKACQDLKSRAIQMTKS